MPMHKNVLDANKKGNSRKRGETIKKVAEFIISSPAISVNQIAEKIGVTASCIRTALDKLINESRYYAVRFSIDNDSITEALIIRDGIIAARKKFMACKKIKVKRVPKDKKTALRLTWRGKANWPAMRASTKKSLTDKELIIACCQHYEYKNGKYVLSKEEKNRAIVLTKNGTNLKTKKGRPTIPITFTFN